MKILLFLWLLLCCLLLPLHDNIFVNSQCLNDEKNLLLQLKQTIYPPQFTSLTPSKLESWVSTTDCCTWEGVECEDGDGHVTTLDLSNEFINTTLFDKSTTLFQLQHLEKLNLAYNNFNYTPIPDDLSHLLNLTHLNLSNSAFGGQVPIVIANLKRLVSLDLSTLFVSRIPLKLENPDLKMLVGNLLGLQQLYLDGLNVSDQAIPESLGNFSSLTSLHLSSCGLRGEFPPKIFQLTKLQTLDVSSNPFLRGSLPQFPQNGSLRNLVLTNTNFSGKLPDSIGYLRLLETLKLTSCRFEGSIPNSLSNLTRLINIDLSTNYLNGTVPYLGLSVNLTQINLAHNRLSGPIPSHWENHRRLVTLNLRNNSLNGTIPLAIFGLPLLQKLYLSDNQFTGQLAEFSSGSTSLDTIDISGNKLGGQIPLSIFHLSSLIIFTVSSNNFNGTLQLDLFEKLNNLSSLDLSSNNLTVNASGTHSNLFPKVGTLKLGSCNLRTFPDFLRNQSKISFLDLSNNGIRGRIPSWIWEIGNGALAHLNLSRNSLEAPEQSLSPRNFKFLAVVDLHSNLLQGPIPILPPSATVLDYSYNNLTSTIPSNTSSYLSVAIYFSISGNKFTGQIPASICNASYLQVLDLSNNNLSGRIPNCLGRMENLGVLNLGKNNFGGTIPKTFSIQCNLRTLDLNGNMLEGKVSKNLSNCTMLEVLDLGNNQIEDTFPIWLGNLTNLRVLVLRSNKFHGVIPQRTNTSNFQMLQIIDLSWNYFEGNLSSTHFSNWKAMMMMTNEEESQSKSKHQTLSFGVFQLTQLYYQDSVTVSSKGMEMELVKILTIFTSIDLSSNKFVGRIPETIGNLTSLYVLNLSHNGLNGSIPSSLGNLKQLESLDLSANDLSGEIPIQLTGLSFLSFLNLSLNRLAGTIPPGSQFQTFSNSSYIGNEELCGSPLSKNCSNLRPSHTSKELPSESGVNFDWQFIVIGLGYGAGASLAVCPVLFWPKGRKWHDELTDRVVLFILPSAGVVYNVNDDSQVDTEESIDDELWEHTEDYEREEDENNQEGRLRRRGRYCVFCSKLDIRRKRALHDPNCKCHASPLNSSSSFFSNS